MIDVLLTLLVLVLILAIVFWIIRILPIEEPFKNIALAIVGIIALLYLLGVLFGVSGLPRLRL